MYTYFAAKPSHSALALQEAYNRTLYEKDELEEKLNNAKLWSKKISELQSSENFLTLAQTVEMDMETRQRTEAINKSEELHNQIKKLEERIKYIQESNNFLRIERMNQIKQEIKTKMEAIEKSKSVKNEIAVIQNNVGFLPDSEIEPLQRELNKVQLVLKEIQTSSVQDLKNSSQEGINAVLQVCVFLEELRF